MRTLTILMIATLFVLAACSSQPLFPENDSNATQENLSSQLQSPVTGDVVSEPETAPEDETPAEPETPVRDTSRFQATVTAVEGETIDLAGLATVTDPDEDPVRISFSEPFAADGTWRTEKGDAGDYEVTVTASDGDAETTATLLVIVERANEAPVITGPSTIRVNEGERVDLGVFTIVDPDGDEFVTSYSGWMDGSEYTTGFEDAGTHTVRVIADDEFGNFVPALLGNVVGGVVFVTLLFYVQARTQVEAN